MNTDSREVWVPAETVADVQTKLDKANQENKGLRGLILRLKEKLTGRKQEEDFDSEFPGPLE